MRNPYEQKLTPTLLMKKVSLVLGTRLVNPERTSCLGFNNSKAGSVWTAGNSVVWQEEVYLDVF